MPRKQILKERAVVRVTFELPAEVEGETVHLVGDFTSWKGIPMEKKSSGAWQTTVDLEPGRSFEFRYLIDGSRWENDWAADRYVRNPFGHENSVIETPPLPATVGSAGGTAARKAATTKSPAGKTASSTAAAAKPAAKKTAGRKTTKDESASRPAATKKGTAKKAPSKTAGRKKDGRKTTDEPGA
jgi:hypothetical protein